MPSQTGSQSKLHGNLAGKMKYTGLWHIQDMDGWDEDYFNMERQAYIKVESRGLGEFQFGLVTGRIDGEILEITGEESRFIFTWEGSDELDPASGAGWLRVKDKDTLEGWIKFHLGDSSKFTAKRAKARSAKRARR